MRKIGKFPLIVIIVLVWQLALPAIATIAETKAMKSDDDNKISVELLEKRDDSLIWLITINAASKENEGIQTNVKLDAGLTPVAITELSGVKIKKMQEGYDIKTPGGKESYEIELQTKIVDNGKSLFLVEATTVFDEKKYKASMQAKVDIATDQREVKEQESDVIKETVKQESVTKNEEESEEDTASGQIEEKETVDTEATESDEVKQEKEIAEEIPANYQEGPDEGVKSVYFPHRKSNSIRAFSNDIASEWPNPGSIKLDGKTAISTETFGEWDITLGVEGKNTKTTSDIVLVFDKSGSMNDHGRLGKAKTAAKKFVNELLIEGSTTRIAIVTFSTEHEQHINFTGVAGKQNLLNAIDDISASGGTNIQGGLNRAQELLTSTNATNKTIVLLSDGEPTYSYKASHARAYNWPYGNYNFILSNFSRNKLGDGANYNLSASSGCIPIFGCLFPGQQYDVGGFTVKTHGVATISEAQAIINNGINMYSIGLEVAGNTNAENVIKNSQNKGFYFGIGDELDEIFGEIAAKLNYAATEAVVTDPLGEMFNLVTAGKDFDPATDVQASHGTVSYDEASETLTWNIGDVKEGEKPTLTYTVSIDWEHPNLKGNVDYPMNKETPLHYKDVNGNNATKHFAIPEGKIDHGKIIRIGYRVNLDGEPIDASGNVVVDPKDAEVFYDEYFEANGSPFFLFGSHDIPAKDVPEYTLFVGDNPTTVSLDAKHPVKTVLFGYVKGTDMKAGDVTVKYVDEAGNALADEKVLSGKINERYETVQKTISGYEFKKMDKDSAAASGSFTKEPQTVIYVYTKKLGSITVNKVDDADENKFLPGATFDLQDEAGNVIASETTDANGKIIFDQLEIGKYTLIETKAPEGYRMSIGEIAVVLTEDDLHVTKTIKNSQSDWEIPKTGGIGTLGFYGIGVLLMVAALLFLFRKRKA